MSLPVLPEPAWPRQRQLWHGHTLRPLLTRRLAVDYCRVATALCLGAPRHRSQLP